MSHRKTHDEFVSELSSINPEVEVLSQYYTALTKVLIKCCICGNQWEAKPSALLHGSGCPECAKRRKGNSLRKTHEQFVSELALVNARIQVLDHYTGNRNKLMIKCLVCNHEWKTTPHDLLSGHGCPECGLVMRQNGVLVHMICFVDMGAPSAQKKNAKARNRHHSTDSTRERFCVR